jgi:acylphosphatase
MLTMIKELFAEKVSMKLMIRGRVTLAGGHVMERLIRSESLHGTLRVVENQSIEAILEGAKPKMERLIAQIPTSAAAAGGKTIETQWGVYENRYATLYVFYSR